MYPLFCKVVSSVTDDKGMMIAIKKRIKTIRMGAPSSIDVYGAGKCIKSCTFVRVLLTRLVVVFVHQAQSLCAAEVHTSVR